MSSGDDEITLFSRREKKRYRIKLSIRVHLFAISLTCGTYTKSTWDHTYVFADTESRGIPIGNKLGVMIKTTKDIVSLKGFKAALLFY